MIKMEMLLESEYPLEKYSKTLQRIQIIQTIILCLILMILLSSFMLDIVVIIYAYRNMQELKAVAIPLIIQLEKVIKLFIH